jgi:GT2 family glycosyltransferase
MEGSLPSPSRPRVSVVVVTRDRAATLRETLPRHAPYPAIVVDNGSADDTLAVARAAGAQTIALGRNAGAAGRTAGVRLAATPYVAFADDDSWWAPGALERAAAVLDAHPRLAVLAATVLVGPDERLDPVCREMADSPLAPVAAGPAVLGFVACGAVVRKDAYLAIGGFPEPYGIGGEEEPLALDLVAAGWELAYVPDVVAHHHPSPARNPRRRVVVQRRNALWTAWRRRPLRVAFARTLRALGDEVGRSALREAFGQARWALTTRRPAPPGVERAVRLLER